MCMHSFVHLRNCFIKQLLRFYIRTYISMLCTKNQVHVHNYVDRNVRIKKKFKQNRLDSYVYTYYICTHVINYGTTYYSYSYVYW